MASYLLPKVVPSNRHKQATGAAVTNILAPSTYQWTLEDISAADAGRSTALHMIKMLQGQARVLNLAWKGKTYAEVSAILKAFKSEYVLLTYFDAESGQHETKHFYMSGKTANSYSALDGGRWELLTMKCIQAQIDRVTPT